MTDGAASAPAFVAVDWGTSSFRLWLIAGDGGVLGESRGGEGMMHCSTAGFEPVLERHLAVVNAPSWLPVMICGMAGARQGWIEAPYLDVPTALDALPRAAVAVPHDGRDIRILPGLCQRDPHAPNVMRGEETQLLGLRPQARGHRLVCMPGTHSKWVTLEDDKVVSFQSYMTGELYAVLTRHAVLRHAVVPDSRTVADDPVFLGAFESAYAEPARVWARLFEPRPAQLLGLEETKDGAAHLSGLLIGAEIGAASMRSSQRGITLVGSGQLGRLYAAALERAGFELVLADAEQVTRDGLVHAAGQIWGTNNG